MPRFHFHQHDGRDILDDDGTILPDVESARLAATKAFLEMVRDHIPELWQDGSWSMTVTDGTGLALFSLELSVTEASAVKRPTGRTQPTEEPPSDLAAPARGN
jgi:hypothetical protein